jgi:hypothetical protein
MQTHYRDWQIYYQPTPLPIRHMDWNATSPDYDASYEGPEDGWVTSGKHLTAESLEELKKEIDFYITEEQME